jgi:NADPH2:quinone reductase
MSTLTRFRKPLLSLGSFVYRSSSSTTAASVCNKIGDPLIYQTDWPIASPGPGEVKVKVAAVGVNFAEILQTRGQYQEVKEAPFCPGNECAGEVCEVGEGSHLKIGDLVICLARGSAYASECIADSRACIKLPPAAASADLAEAAALLVNYGTAHLALEDRAGMKAGESVLITAAAGGVGLAAVELARLMGAGQIIAAVGSESKLDLAKSKGATSGLIYSGLDQKGVRGAIKEAAGKKGVDVVVDMVGADVLEPSLRTLNWGGRGVVIGFAGGVSVKPQPQPFALSLI